MDNNILVGTFVVVGVVVAIFANVILVKILEGKTGAEFLITRCIGYVILVIVFVAMLCGSLFILGACAEVIFS